MKTTLLVIFIVCVSLCVLSFLISLFFNHGYYNLMDGSHGQYARLRCLKTVFFITGIVLAVISAACLIIRFKL